MAKRFGGRVTPKGTRPANFKPDKRSLHNQAQQLKKEVDEARDRVAEEEFDGTAGDGKVTVVLKGDGRAVSVTVADGVELSNAELGELFVEASLAAWERAALARKAAVDEVIANTKADLGYIGLDGIVN